MLQSGSSERKPSDREIESFPLNSDVKKKLVAKGFKTISDFSGIKPIALAQETNITNKEAVTVLNMIDNGIGTSTNPTTRLEGSSAFDLLNKSLERNPIVTLCKEFDEMLNGGIPIGSITEFCGVPGIGKTQLGIQLSVNVQIPPPFGGIGGKAIYIDTEGSFMVERAIEIGESVIRSLQKQTEIQQDSEKEESLKSFNTETILNNIFYYRIHDYIEQVALLNILPSFLRENPDVRLIVFDSITFHFRHDFEDLAYRSRLLHGMAQSLSEISNTFDIGVALMNQVTTKFDRGEAYLAPALGESWAHASTNRIILYQEGKQRMAHLYKSPFLASKTVPFRITQDGIRSIRRVTNSGVVEPNASSDQQQQQGQQEQYSQETPSQS